MFYFFISGVPIYVFLSLHTVDLSLILVSRRWRTTLVSRTTLGDAAVNDDDGDDDGDGDGDGGGRRKRL